MGDQVVAAASVSRKVLAEPLLVAPRLTTQLLRRDQMVSGRIGEEGRRSGLRGTPEIIHDVPTMPQQQEVQIELSQPVARIVKLRQPWPAT